MGVCQGNSKVPGLESHEAGVEHNTEPRRAAGEESELGRSHQEDEDDEQEEGIEDAVAEVMEVAEPRKCNHGLLAAAPSTHAGGQDFVSS